MVSITVNAVNDPPVAVADTATTDEDVYVDINVITNDTDVDNANSQLSVANITDVQGGTALLQANGRTVRFTPALNANSTTTPGGFSFKVHDEGYRRRAVDCGDGEHHGQRGE